MERKQSKNIKFILRYKKKGMKFQLKKTNTTKTVMQLKAQFQNSKVDALSIASYFCKMKELSDNLTLAGHHLLSIEFTMQLLNEPPLEHEVVVAFINSSREHIEIEENQSMLLDQEMWITQVTSKVTLAANVVDKHSQQKQSNAARPSCANQLNSRGGLNSRGHGKGCGHNRGWNNNK